MTMTDTAPATGTNSEVVEAPNYNYGKLAELVATGEHARIGRFFLGGGMLGLIGTLTVGLLLDLERTSPTKVEILDSDVLGQLISSHRLGLLLIGIIPALIGLAISVVPLQVGARTIAFPRAAALGFWTWLMGTVLWLAGYLMGGGPGGGDLQGTDLWILGNIMVVGGLLVATASVVTTVLGMRTTGMNLARTPLFSFSMLVAGSVWFITLPVLVANLVLVYIDHRYGQVLFGASEAIYAQLAWLAGQPQIYAVAIPVLGILGETVPVFAKARSASNTLFQVAISAFGLFAIGVWAQFSMSNVANPDATSLLKNPIYIAFGTLVVIPVLLALALSAATIRAGKLNAKAPFISALLAGLVLLAATVAGLLNVIEPLDLAGTTAALGHFNLVAGAAILGLVAGLWFWAPKIYGNMLAEGPGRLLGLVLALGALLAGVGFVAGGFLEQPDSPNPGALKDGVDMLNLVGVVGSALLLLGVVGAAGAVLGSRRSKTNPGENPWDGHTLEWSTASPPVRGNFTEIPEVSNESPLFSDREEA